ncbi:hypothetical protein ES703_39742 [subsurface metagenome]
MGRGCGWRWGGETPCHVYLDTTYFSSIIRIKRDYTLGVKSMIFFILAIVLAILISLVFVASSQGQAWPMLFTPIALTIAAMIAYRQLQHARHTRCAGLLLDIMKWWNSQEMLESRQLVWRMQDATAEILSLYKAKDKKFGIAVRMGQFGEALGILVLRRYVDKKDIWLLFENDWEDVYQDYSGFLDELKKTDVHDTTFCNLKLLCEELAKIHVRGAQELYQSS